jgi:tubulin-specific chaperone A
MKTNGDQDKTGGIKKFALKRGLGRTLVVWFLGLSLIPLAAVSIISYQNAYRSHHQETEKALSSVLKLKTEKIEYYFHEISTDLRLMSGMRSTTQFLESLNRSFKDSNMSVRDFTQSPTWKNIVEASGADFKNYSKTFGYHDIFLIDSRGNVLFSVAGQDDLGTNLFNGPHSGTLFASACKKTLQTGRPAFSDYEVYSPSNNKDVFGFFSSVIVNDHGNRIGLMTLQFPIRQIDEIMQTKIELGMTAEIYLIGPDLKMRSNSVLRKEQTVLKDPVYTEQTRHWKEQIEKGQEQQKKINSALVYDGPHGKPVLGLHRHIDIESVPFAVIAEIEKKEAFASAYELRNIVFGLLATTAFIVAFISIVISRRIVQPLQILSSSAKRVAGGQLDYKIEISTGNEIGELADSFNHMILNLRHSKEFNETQDRLKVGHAELNEKMRGELDIGTLGGALISHLAEFLNVQIGAIYLADDDGRLRLIGSYAYTLRKNLANEFVLGEGLVGQAALEKKHILITNCPDDYININSGLGEAAPNNILVFPLLLNNTVKGIIELGAFKEFSDFEFTFLRQVSESIAIVLNSALSRKQTVDLLEQTQEQARELQAREEELRHANEELEAQTTALKESESRLLIQQEELRMTNEQLEKSAAELEGQTSVLEMQKANIEKKNKELEDANRLIEEKARDLELSSKYKSEFLANMSHELRTPLNSILLFSRLISANKDDNLTEDQIESAQSIYSSGSDLLALINEVLDLSKVEAGKMELHLEDVNIRIFFAAMERNFQPLASEKKLKFNVDIADDLPTSIRTDQQRVEQILKNLLSNSLKFTSKGGITLRICRPDDQSDDESPLPDWRIKSENTIAFSVIDTGVGIPKEKQTLIFEAFQQSDGTTSRKYGGTGLGLSIARELAKLLGGGIRVKSTPGKGSTFTLYLPETPDPELEMKTADMARHRALPDDQQLKSEKPEGTDQSTETTADRLSSVEAIRDDRKEITPEDKSILIIEDDSKFLKILRDLSREHGFKCLVAGDGETGLQFADYYKPKAIILDIGLPGIDGWTVMARLKENLATRHIPVHFISAADKDLAAIKMGAVDFLTKPVSPRTIAQMYEKLNKIISKKVKDLLVVEDDVTQQKAIEKVIGNRDVRITFASTAAEAYSHVLSGEFDCMVLDLGLPDMSGVELLDKIRNNDELSHLPIIVYTGRELSKEERAIIDEYAESTIIKGAESLQKLLDETTLFLHLVEANLPEEQQKMLQMIHDKEKILENKTVLLVDDDMRNVFSLKRILEDHGMHVLVGKNGKEGLNCLINNLDINLVLMDIMMPEMDGYEAIREIRKQHRFKDLPVIALTAKAMRGDRVKCIEAGASDYLPKPVDVDRLFSMLRVWLY